MATLTAARAASTFPVAKTVGGGALHVAWGSYTLAANPAPADIIQFCRIPAGAVVLGGFLMGPDVDTGVATFDLDVGWADNGVDVADPDGFGNFGVHTGNAVAEIIPVAGIWKPLQGVLLTSGPVAFAAETIITGTVIAAAAAGGTGTLTVVVFYANP